MRSVTKGTSLNIFNGAGIVLSLLSGALYAVDPMTNNQIRDLMIKETIDTHPHCPCPYSADAIGGQCGTESEYYRPGGFKVNCYRIDISSEEVYFYRLKKASYFAPQTIYEEVNAGTTQTTTTTTETTKTVKEDPTAVYFRNNAPAPANKSPFSTLPSMNNGNSNSSFYQNNIPTTANPLTNPVYSNLPQNR